MVGAATPVTVTSTATQTASPVPPTGAALSTQLAELVRTMDGTMNDFAGAVLIAEGNHVLLAHAYGVADEKLRTPVTLAIRFRIGSITKQFTAMAILMLEHQGHLRLSDRVCHYVADCPATWAPVTLSELLTHTSGIPNYTDVPTFPALEPHASAPARVLGLVRNLPLSFPPGTAFEYSNTGFFLLGLVVEKVSGMTYEGFLRQHIFDPLRMRNTGYDHGHQGVAVGYASAGKPADPFDTSLAFSAGALYSTVGDLHLWEQALRAGSLVPKSVVAEMEQPRVKIGNSTGNQYGYGLFIGQIGDASHLVLKIGHTGEINGFISLLSYYPASVLDVVILSNHEDTNLNGIDDKVRQLIVGS